MPPRSTALSRPLSVRLERSRAFDASRPWAHDNRGWTSRTPPPPTRTRASMSCSAPHSAPHGHRAVEAEAAHVLHLTVANGHHPVILVPVVDRWPLGQL